MSSKTPQDAASQKSKEKNPAMIPVPKQKALVINEPSQTRRSEKRAMNTGSSKGKEKMDADRPMKRLRSLADVEISRAEFNGDEILSLYSGDDLVLPSTDNALEDVQEEMRGFIPQALKLANVVTVQLEKMAMRIRELEAENAQAKEVEARLTLALQEQASSRQGSSAEVNAPAEMARQFQELTDDLKGHKAMLLSVRKELAYERTGTHALVEKIKNLETQIHGRPVAESGPDVRREHLIRDVEIARDVFGEGSKEHTTKQADLDRLLRAQVSYAEKKAKKDEMSS